MKPIEIILDPEDVEDTNKVTVQIDDSLLEFYDYEEHNVLWLDKHQAISLAKTIIQFYETTV
jgi:hypothetical protein